MLGRFGGPFRKIFGRTFGTYVGELWGTFSEDSYYVDELVVIMIGMTMDALCLLWWL